MVMFWVKMFFLVMVFKCFWFFLWMMVFRFFEDRIGDCFKIGMVIFVFLWVSFSVRLEDVVDDVVSVVEICCLVFVFNLLSDFLRMLFSVLILFFCRF